MATIFGDVQYSQNGTFTNPCWMAGFQQHGLTWLWSNRGSLKILRRKKWETAFWGFKFWHPNFPDQASIGTEGTTAASMFPQTELQAVERVNVEVLADRQRSGIPRLRLTAQTDLNFPKATSKYIPPVKNAPETRVSGSICCHVPYLSIYVCMYAWM